MRDMIMIGWLVIAVFLSPLPENLPEQDPTQRPRQLTGPDSNGNRQSSASFGGGRLDYFERGQMGHLAKECPRRASVHFN